MPPTALETPGSFRCSRNYVIRCSKSIDPSERLRRRSAPRQRAQQFQERKIRGQEGPVASAWGPVWRDLAYEERFREPEAYE